MGDATKLNIRIRMYRQGLGDCFLITFTHPGGLYHMLIDCGVLRGTEKAQEEMRKVVTNIAETTHSRLDLVVATHEHWDHLSGFLQARDLWDTIDVKEVWLAWTEDADPSNTFARQLRESRKQKVANLCGLVDDSQSGLDDSTRQGLTAILDFFGDPPGLDSKMTTHAALEYITAKPNGNVKYHTPGQKIEQLPGVPGVNIYVLGPPTDQKLLFKDQPSAKHSEIYELNGAMTLAERFFTAVDGTEAAEQACEDGASCFPFHKKYRVELADAQNDRFCIANYFGKDTSMAWRKIDGDWLDAANELALALDSDTNNTSLALAIELVDSGKVLLFPGDAQVGNWLSWQNLMWSAKDKDGQPREVTARALLNQTVFYKVGHHGSHNATLSELGLELMSRDLVAMIPVNKAMAQRQGPKDADGKPRGWNMPFPSLLSRLKKKTRGRVIQLDDGVPERVIQFDDGDTDIKPLSEAEWEQFKAVIGEGPDNLYIDYTINDA